MAERITSPFMTKYERARIIGWRAQQIASGYPPLIQVEDEEDPIVIASDELRLKKCPLIIRRVLPSNEYEEWDVNELIMT